jgi:hypothetical protein
MDVVVYRARRMDKTVAREIDRLRRELPDFMVVVVCYQKDYLPSDSDPVNMLYCYGKQELETLPYPGKIRDMNWNNPTGHHDLPVLKYYRDHPDFDSYWIIEDDVRFSGPWTDLFGELAEAQADFLAANLDTQDKKPIWHWWETLDTAGEILTKKQRIKCFGPFIRARRICVEAVDRRYESGWSGHFELTWPTICVAANLKLEDIGGSGDFTPEGRRNRFYVNTPSHWHLFPGTFVFRPTFKDTEMSKFVLDFFSRPMLWHPVKP